MDYPLAAPFCALWGAVFPDNLVVIYRELYQADLTPDQQAKLVKASERPGERTPGRPLPVALDPSCWQRPATTITKPIEPDAPAEGSIAWSYRRELGGAVRKAHNDRLGGWALIDRHLRRRGDGLPRLLVYSTCRNLIRTLPALQRSATNPEDIITSPKQDDHPADALRYLLQLLVGGGHDRTARDADLDPTGRTDTRDLAYDTNLITTRARPTSPMEVTSHRFGQGPSRQAAATASPSGHNATSESRDLPWWFGPATIHVTGNVMPRRYFKARKRRRMDLADWFIAGRRSSMNRDDPRCRHPPVSSSLTGGTASSPPRRPRRRPPPESRRHVGNLVTDVGT